MQKAFQWSAPVDVRTFTFPGGERQVRLADYDESGIYKPWTLKARLKSADDIMDLLLTADAVRRNCPDMPLFLECPYLPYARQDRECHPGEAFSLEVMAKILNTANFDRIFVWDVHSDVSGQLIPGLLNVPASKFMKGHLRKGELVVAPDKGAVHRAKEVARADCIPGAGDGEEHPVVLMDKVRDPDDGRISGFRLLSSLEGVDTSEGAIVVDDICDGGRTFIGVADVLRKHVRGPLRLYVTHGIFSAGFDDLLEAYDEILVANPMTDGPLPERVRVIAQF